ncbi:MAG: hypothetical protein WEB58_23950 [Planctomycetaceae bacterium]
MSMARTNAWGQDGTDGAATLRSTEISAAVSTKTARVAALQAPAAAPPAPPPPIPRTPPFAQPNIQPTLLDWLTAKPIAEKIKIRKTDPLLRPPFSDVPVNSLKGVAAKIRAEELDTCNRVKAVKYLGTVDCKAFPEAQDQLIDAMHNDKFAIVRYEAAMALGHMLCKSGDPKSQKILCSKKIGGDKCGKGLLKKHDKNKHYVSGLSACEGCCNEKVIQALEKTAYEQDEFCCWFEPSYMVRQAAIKALECCDDWCPPASAPTDVPPIPGGEPREEEKKEELLPPDPKQEPDANASAVSQVSASSTRFAPHPTPANAPEHLPELKALNGYCVVAMKDKEFLRTQPKIWSIREGRIYYFSSQNAKAAFDANPDNYAVRWAGMDVVAYCTTGEFAEGSYLHLNADGNLYLFATRENRALFQDKSAFFIAESKRIADGNASPDDLTVAEPEKIEAELSDAPSDKGAAPKAVKKKLRFLQLRR